MMIGIGTPSSQSKIPRPMEFSFQEKQGLLVEPNSAKAEKFLRLPAHRQMLQAIQPVAMIGLL